MLEDEPMTIPLPVYSFAEKTVETLLELGIYSQAKKIDPDVFFAATHKSVLTSDPPIWTQYYSNIAHHPAFWIIDRLFKEKFTLKKQEEVSKQEKNGKSIINYKLTNWIKSET